MILPGQSSLDITGSLKIDTHETYREINCQTYLNLFESNAVEHKINKETFLTELTYRIAGLNGKHFPAVNSKAGTPLPFKELFIISPGDRDSLAMVDNKDKEVKDFRLMAIPPDGALSSHPIFVNFKSNYLEAYFNKYPPRKHVYMVRLISAIIPTSMEKLSDGNEPNILFVRTNGLNDAKRIHVVDGTQVDCLGIINLNAIKIWSTHKTYDNQVAVTFENSSDATPQHISFPFRVRNTSNLARFEISLHSGKNMELIKFGGKAQKAPVFILDVSIRTK